MRTPSLTATAEVTQAEMDAHIADDDPHPSGAIALGGAVTSLSRAGLYSVPPHSVRTTLVVTLQRLYYLPFRVQRTRTFDRIGVDVTTGVATAVVRLGIYADAADYNFPGALLLDAGTVDASAAAFAVATINQQLTPGLWWLAAVAQVAAPTLRASDKFAEHVATAAAGSAAFGGLAEAGVGGALPAIAAPTLESGTLPLVFVRAV